MRSLEYLEFWNLFRLEVWGWVFRAFIFIYVCMLKNEMSVSQILSGMTVSDKYNGSLIIVLHETRRQEKEIRIGTFHGNEIY